MDSAGFVNALYGAVLGNSQSAAGGQTGTTSYVTLEWPGLPLDPAQFGNIWATDNQTGSPEALENFTGIADDDMPALSPLFQSTGVSLEMVYNLILQATVPSGPLANSFAAAQATFAAVTRGSLQNPAVLFHPSSPAPRTWCDPAGEASWTTVQIGAGAPPSPLPPPILKSVIARPELAQWRISAAPTTRALPTGPVTMAHPMALAAAAPNTTVLETHPEMASAVVERASLATLRPVEASAPASIALPAETLARLKTLPPSRIPIRIGPVSPGPIHPLPVPPPKPRPIGASNLTATFRYKRVSIARPWIDTTLFHLPGWSITGLPPGSISTGNSDSNPGLLPLLPVAFIAIRDVAIRGTWSDADKANAREALAGNTVASFGPLSLSTKSGAATFDGSSLLIPGIQAIIWQCQLLPKMPPA